MPQVMYHSGFIYSLETALKMLLDYQVVFLGEQHHSAEAHKAELDLLTGLYNLDPGLVLALEMFERDVQEILNDYLQGKISEAEFLERSRPWPNYPKDYRPLIEFARLKGIPVVAANVPRRAAAAVARANRIAPEVLGPDGPYLPERPPFDSRKYYQLFQATLADMPAGGPMGHAKPRALYKAQLVKDAVMAAALDFFLDRRILFCCGHFHSDYHLGIPYQLRKTHPGLKIAVIAMASVVDEVPMNRLSQLADFFWIPDE
ncbi:MAG: ChaN family lipoprotein [Deltaproteobacteria bacterium]|nr:ChaN family lipoprotein [Deltaproteobacteria bacterium]